MNAAAGTQAGRTRHGHPLGAILALLIGCCLIWPAPPAAALGLPGRRQPPQQPRSLAATAPSRLQEVAPPPVVQDLRLALAEHEPRIRIVSPTDGSLLPAGPWTLRLQVEDWPLVDAGPLGLGPHLVAQLDDHPPIRLTGTEAAMPALSPGSHRLTVYAARPWGESVKSPGAYRQIRLHRVTANPLTLPAPGSPQLIPVMPGASPQREPVLLDWLLLDAPLQNLRGVDTDGWRLRVTVNGDSFLVDQQTPLWLKGWRNGDNALQLELVDGRGEALNPPFNSLVNEVTVSGSAPQPRWQGGPLQPEERARLLGEAPPEPEPEPEPELKNQVEALPAMPAAGPVAEPEPETQEPQLSEPGPEPDPVGPPVRQAATAALPAQEDQPEEGEAAAPPPEPVTVQQLPGRVAVAAPEQPLRQPMRAGDPPAEGDAPPATATPTPTVPLPPPPDSPSAPRSTRSTMPPAREEVNPDGTLIRPTPQGPLARLRERLNR